MPTTVLELDAKDRVLLYSIFLNSYLNGECYALATALNEGLGWPMIGLIDEAGIVQHAAVTAPDGRYFDARGYVNGAALAEPFLQLQSSPLRITPLSEIGLREREPAFARENSVRNARLLAEALWPELPWKTSFSARVKAFCDELEQLSRQHQLWIRATYPGARPVFAFGAGDEAGYQSPPTADARSFTLDRHLES